MGDKTIMVGNWDFRNVLYTSWAFWKMIQWQVSASPNMLPAQGWQCPPIWSDHLSSHLVGYIGPNICNMHILVPLFDRYLKISATWHNVATHSSEEVFFNP